MVSVYEEGTDTDRIFQALSNGTRRDILKRVMTDDICVSALAKRYPMSFAAVQKHVAVLESAGLVGKSAKGREQLVRGDVGTVEAVKDLLEELEELWRSRLERFEDVLNETKG